MGLEPRAESRAAPAPLKCAWERDWPQAFVLRPFSGMRLSLGGVKPIRGPAPGLKGVLPSMNRGTRTEKALLREAFDLLLTLRSRPQATKLLRQAVTYLRLLERRGEPGEPPLVLSVQVMRLTKL